MAGRGNRDATTNILINIHVSDADIGAEDMGLAWDMEDGRSQQKDLKSRVQ
jgi:hypothetical protein